MRYTMRPGEGMSAQLGASTLQVVDVSSLLPVSNA
jgi:hypothetical protein